MLRVVLFISALMSLQLSAAASSSKIESLIQKSKIPKAQLSLLITEDEKVIYELNSNQKMIPASISKIATASAVLSALNGSERFKTRLFTDGKNLYLKGGGDPSFVSESMWFLVNQFLRSGIREIKGDIIVDDHIFDQVRFDESREDARVDRAYDAPVSGMSFNWNSVNIYVRPGTKGQKAEVTLDPENDYVELINKTTTVAGSKNSLQVSRRVKDKTEVFTVSGEIGTGQSEIAIYKNITRPDLWSGENLKSFLKQRQVRLLGEVKTGRVPEQAKEVAVFESKPIEHIVADMNKFSNNYVAEMLTKALASREMTAGATLARGVGMINDHLKVLGLKEEEYYFENPSGLTRDNRFSARSMWKILTHLRHDLRDQPEFFSSLPIAGRDGTLKRRMKNTVAQDWVRAKTGLLTGVTSLAGYAGQTDGKVFTFVFIHNGAGDESRVRALFDDFLVSLLDTE